MSDSRLNGKTGEFLRYVLGLALAGMIAYFTAQASIQRDISTQKATEESHFGEVMRRLEVMQQDIRELRDRR